MAREANLRGAARIRPSGGTATVTARSADAQWKSPSREPPTGCCPPKTRKATGGRSSRPTPPWNPTTFFICTFWASLIRPKWTSSRNIFASISLPMAAGIFSMAVPAELNATVKAYVALRLAVILRRLRIWRRPRRRSTSLAAWKRPTPTSDFIWRWWAQSIGGLVPAIPPELMLLPNWFPINIYEMSSWTRGIVIPLVIDLCQQAGMAAARRHRRLTSFSNARARSRWPSHGTSALSPGATVFSRWTAA